MMMMLFVRHRHAREGVCMCVCVCVCACVGLPVRVCASVCERVPIIKRLKLSSSGSNGADTVTCLDDFSNRFSVSIKRKTDTECLGDGLYIFFMNAAITI